MAFCAFAPASASLAISVASAVLSGPSASARCASVRIVEQARVVVPSRAELAEEGEHAGVRRLDAAQPVEVRLGELGLARASAS